MWRNRKFQFEMDVTDVAPGLKFGGLSHWPSVSLTHHLRMSITLLDGMMYLSVVCKYRYLHHTPFLFRGRYPLTKKIVIILSVYGTEASNFFRTSVQKK